MSVPDRIDDFPGNGYLWTMTSQQPLCIVIRIPEVSLSESDLNASLGFEVSRYEPSSGRAYAQIDIPDHQDQWGATLDCIQSIRAAIQGLVSKSLIGAPNLDVAIGFPCTTLSKSLTIPAGLAAAAGEAGMDIDLSVCQTE
jgi:hypothetical protein